MKESRKMIFLTFILIILVGHVCNGFQLNKQQIVTKNNFISSKRIITRSSVLCQQQPTRRSHAYEMKLHMSNQFDITKPTFDLLSLRAVRGDAVVRYDSLNQSEPLRIILFAIFGATSLSAPFLVEAIGYEPMNTPTSIVSVIFAISSGALFYRECSRRSKQLKRIEKELNSESLPIRLPNNILAEMPFSKTMTLKNLRSTQRPPRIIAICGNRSKLIETLSTLAVYRQRLSQASVFVVAVPTDGSTREDWQVLNKNAYRSWLADSYQPQLWLDYFQELSEETTNTNEDNDLNFRWFGLNSNGRSFGSGDGEIRIIQLMGQFLRPTDFLDMPDDDNINNNIPKILSDDSATEKEILENVQVFYKALTTGDQNAIESVYSKTPSNEVSEVVDSGGRIDTWKDCLADGARPSEMKISGADVTIVSDFEAYTTVIEFPANTGMDDASLLAIQRFTRTDKNDPWKLVLHQTIPWSLETKAQGTLQCDCRGCVALTRSKERRTFGGIIG